MKVEIDMLLNLMSEVIKHSVLNPEDSSKLSAMQVFIEAYRSNSLDTAAEAWNVIMEKKNEILH